MDTSACVGELRGSIYGPPKRAIVDIALDCLYFTADHPEAREAIGVIWSPDPHIFLLCTRIFSAFTGEKENSVHRNRHDHGFVTHLETAAVPGELRSRRYIAWSHPRVVRGVPRDRLTKVEYRPLPKTRYKSPEHENVIMEEAGEEPWGGFPSFPIIEWADDVDELGLRFDCAEGGQNELPADL
jgi:hypothetical protein